MGQKNSSEKTHPELSFSVGTDWVLKTRTKALNAGAKIFKLHALQDQSMHSFVASLDSTAGGTEWFDDDTYLGLEGWSLVAVDAASVVQSLFLQILQYAFWF